MICTSLSSFVSEQYFILLSEYARELGYAPSLDSQTTYDSYTQNRYKTKAKIDQESFRNWREKVLADTFRSTPKPTKNAWFAAEEPEKKGIFLHLLSAL